MTTYAIGTSGYSYKQWKGAFYPEDLGSKEMLAFYAGRLSSVEINSTFYRFATPRQLAAWAGEVGDGFTSTLKAPRRITHNLRLRDAGELAGDFCRSAMTLGEKLGAVLFQLPPNVKKDVPRLAGFLDELPAGPRLVFEFRHASWSDEEVDDCLRQRGVALCETDSGDGSPRVESTADFGYMRMRQEQYATTALELAAARLRDAGQRWRHVSVYFKHEDQGPAYALRLRELLE